MGAHTHALHQLPVRGTRTRHHPSREWQRPLWPLPAKPHPHLLSSFLVHMIPGWLTLRILGNYLWFPISGPYSPAHLPPRHIPARWPEKPLPRLPLEVLFLRPLPKQGTPQTQAPSSPGVPFHLPLFRETLPSPGFCFALPARLGASWCEGRGNLGVLLYPPPPSAEPLPAWALAPWLCL